MLDYAKYKLAGPKNRLRWRGAAKPSEIPATTNVPTQKLAVGADGSN